MPFASCRRVTRLYSAKNALLTREMVLRSRAILAEIPHEGMSSKLPFKLSMTVYARAHARHVQINFLLLVSRKVYRLFMSKRETCATAYFVRKVPLLLEPSSDRRCESRLCSFLPLKRKENAVSNTLLIRDTSLYACVLMFPTLASTTLRLTFVDVRSRSANQQSLVPTRNEFQHWLFWREKLLVRLYAHTRVPMVAQRARLIAGRTRVLAIEAHYE